MEKKAKNLEIIIDNTPVAMAYLDNNFNFIRVNKAYAEVDEKNIAYFPGKNHFEVYPNEENKKIFQKVVKSGESFFIRGKPFIYPNNPERGVTYWDWSLIPIKSSGEKVKGLVFTLRDVTDREIARQNLEESNRRLNFYKDLLAHDMRNILFVIQSSTELLEKQGQKLTDSKEMIKKIKKQVGKGADLISNVQKLSDAEKEDRVIESVDLYHIVKDAISYAESRFKDNKLAINKNFPIEPSIDVKGGELLIDAFENILINGISYNDRDVKKMWISISHIKRNGENYVKLEFKDNGNGIPDNEKEKVFMRGVKTSNSNGMGIGLSLVKEIIAGYGGEVWVKNRIADDYTKGSNFIILLKEAQK
ncbi:MAG: ATP-binding protein [Promethearchaeia archaeon]